MNQPEMVAVDPAVGFFHWTMLYEPPMSGGSGSASPTANYSPLKPGPGAPLTGTDDGVATAAYVSGDPGRGPEFVIVTL